MGTGSPFQAFGPATLKARSPNFSLVRFMAKEKLDPDRSSRLSWSTKHGVTISFRYNGNVINPQSMMYDHMDEYYLEEDKL